jgi:VIT1/CCC1 family predicted Fe2+/Mn2+ transporter
VIIGVTYGLAALVPLWPYLVWDLSTAMAMSFVSAAVALVALAFAKARIAGVGVTRNAVEAAVGAASAAIGYFIGWAAESWIS